MVSEIIEEFRLIQEFEDYQISNMGRVYSLKTKRILSSTINSRGYLKIGLRKDKKQTTHGSSMGVI